MLKICILLVCMLCTAYCYNYGYEMAADNKLCVDLIAGNNDSTSYHGPRDGRDPSSFVLFDIKKDGNNPVENVWDITVNINEAVTPDGFIGWAIQVREYGARDVGQPDSYPWGTVIAHSGVSDGWNCPNEQGLLNVRNGVVHLDGPLYETSFVKSITFKWTHTSDQSNAVPYCARAVGTVLSNLHNWWHAEESTCILSNDGQGNIVTPCPQECDLYAKRK